MQQAMKGGAGDQQVTTPNFVIQKRTDGGPGASIGTSGFDKVSELMVNLVLRLVILALISFKPSPNYIHN